MGLINDKKRAIGVVGVNFVKSDVVNGFEDIFLHDGLPRTAGDEFALVEEKDVIGVTGSEIDVMKNDEDSETGCCTIFEDVHHLLNMPKVEVGAGLVEEENFGCLRGICGGS